ncbi:MAG: DUF1552 domain-containing protein [Myxococcales bacterium]|nr:DUF1552 domain-containing protein [Myxococcales bacterium]MCB9523616.1 DUF1552 domain-containing protein [Myxococcales bacterium]
MSARHLGRGLDRRRFLQAGAGSLLALPLLQAGRAFGQPATPPRRLLVWFTPNGVNPETWFPAPGSTERDFTLGQVLTPLRRHQQRLIVTQGIDMLSPAMGPGEPHQAGMGAVLTGTHLQPGDFVGGDGTLAGWADGVSVDQLIARQIGADTRVPSLELGVRVAGSEVRHRINYAGPANPLPPNEVPRAVYARLFSALDPADPALAARLNSRRSALDAVRRQFALVRGQVGAADRARLDAHASLVRDIERRLSAEAAACVAPDQPPLFNPGDEDHMAQATELMVDLAVAALACDQTRVITLQLSSGANNIRFPHLSSTQDDHQLSHAGPGDAMARAEWARRKVWYATQFARLLDLLEAIPEGDGTLLDHTQILWCSELAQGNSHSHANMPFLLAGGGAGWATGRYLRFEGRAHNDLLLSLARAFGVGVDAVGRRELVRGPLPGLEA